MISCDLQAVDLADLRSIQKRSGLMAMHVFPRRHMSPHFIAFDLRSIYTGAKAVRTCVWYEWQTAYHRQKYWIFLPLRVVFAKLYLTDNLKSKRLVERNIVRCARE